MDKLKKEIKPKQNNFIHTGQLNEFRNMLHNSDRYCGGVNIQKKEYLNTDIILLPHHSERKLFSCMDITTHFKQILDCLCLQCVPQLKIILGNFFADPAAHHTRGTDLL